MNIDSYNWNELYKQANEFIEKIFHLQRLIPDACVFFPVILA